MFFLANFWNIARMHNYIQILSNFKKKRRQRFWKKWQKPHFWAILAIFGPFWPYFMQNLRNYVKNKKSAWIRFLALIVPYFMPCFRKIVGAVSEIIRNARTHGRTDARRLFYRTLRFSTGDQQQQKHIYKFSKIFAIPPTPSYLLYLPLPSQFLCNWE